MNRPDLMYWVDLIFLRLQVIGWASASVCTLARLPFVRFVGNHISRFQIESQQSVFQFRQYRILSNVDTGETARAAPKRGPEKTRTFFK
jgi:hypothetical protein